MSVRALVVRTAVAVLAAGGVAMADATRPPRDLVRRIDTYVRPFVDDGHLSGTLLVAQNDKVLYERSWGMANVELRVPNAPATRFCVASITKPMTVAVFCRLAEEHRVDPADTLGKWIPGFPHGGTITLSHVLNHRACIPHRVTTDCEEAQPHTTAEMVELVKKSTFLAHAPGERSVYSSAGYSVLARVLEIASGQPYGELLATRVFAPADMRNSSHPGLRELIPNRATSYAPGLDGPRRMPLQDPSFLVGAGSVYSTPRDLHAMMQALLTGKLGDAARTALVRDDGLRWNGITNGYRAFADYYKDTGFAVIFTGNMHTGACDRLRDNVPKILAGEAVQIPERLRVTAAVVAESVLVRYEGVFESEHGQRFTTSTRDGRLFAGDRELVPLSATTFYSLQEYGRVEVVHDAHGAVERLDWEWQGAMMPWKRVGDATGPGAPQP